MRSFSGRKRKKIYITSDCVCDLPEEILEEYDIRLMYFYIRTDKGRFADIKEISSDNLTEYLSAEGVKAYADSASVEEYKEFFAETLTQAEQVIHISMAKNIGQSYKSAVAAAEGFDHVRVIDSGQISGGEGLLVLYAAQLVLEGYHAQEIVEKINEQKSLISNQIILKNANYLQPNSYISKVLTQICNSFRLHPMLTLKRSRLFWGGVQGGKLENAWKYFVYRSMMKKKKICDDIILVTYVGCNVEQLELVQKEILKNIAFQKVIIQKASCSTACNSGIGSVSISYFYGNKADEKQERVTK